jgi:hypothetical protein
MSAGDLHGLSRRITTRKAEPMLKLADTTFLSLDGLMQGPGGPEEDPTGHFTKGGWNVTFSDDVMGRAMTQAFENPYELLLVGSETSTTGVVIATYQRAGDVPVGSFQLDEPTEAEVRCRAGLVG